MGRRLTISEIFYSILGESTYQGLPCAFVRLGGCNLRCSYCDTPYAWEGGKEYSIEEILSHLAQYPTRLVEITGGEPLLQKGIYELIERFIEKKYQVLIETNGSINIGKVPSEVTIIMDIKCPSSGMADKMEWGNIEKLKNEDEIKFVLQDFSDYLWAKRIIEKYHLSSGKILLSPLFDKLSPKDLSKWILNDGLRGRVHLQLHKIIGVK